MLYLYVAGMNTFIAEQKGKPCTESEQLNLTKPSTCFILYWVMHQFQAFKPNLYFTANRRNDRGISKYDPFWGIVEEYIQNKQQVDGEIVVIMAVATSYAGLY